MHSLYYFPFINLIVMIVIACTEHRNSYKKYFAVTNLIVLVVKYAIIILLLVMAIIWGIFSHIGDLTHIQII